MRLVFHTFPGQNSCLFPYFSRHRIRSHDLRALYNICLIITSSSMILLFQTHLCERKTKTLHHFEFAMSCLVKFKQDKKCMGNRNCPGQHDIYQGLFPYFSRIFPYFSIPMIIFQTFQGLKNSKNICKTFPGSVRTLTDVRAYWAAKVQCQRYTRVRQVK